MYTYNAQVIRVVDGDTVWLNVDLGMDSYLHISCRLYGINSPEMSTPEGVAAKEFVEGILHPGTTVELKTIKDKKEKYGRYLAIIDLGGENLNDLIVSSGHAVPYFP